MLRGEGWCPQCGATQEPSLFDVEIRDPGFECPKCFLGLWDEHNRIDPEDVHPNASRKERRVLYHLINKGHVRICFNSQPQDWDVEIHETTTSTEQARQIISNAVRPIEDQYAHTHVRWAKGTNLPKARRPGYVIGHWRERFESWCDCNLR